MIVMCLGSYRTPRASRRRSASSGSSDSKDSTVKPEADHKDGPPEDPEERDRRVLFEKPKPVSLQMSDIAAPAAAAAGPAGASPMYGTPRATVSSTPDPNKRTSRKDEIAR